MKKELYWKFESDLSQFENFKQLFLERIYICNISPNF